MKKIVLVFGFLFALAASTQAQSGSDGTGFRFGMQASPTWSWMTTSDKRIEGVGANWGLKLGVVGEHYFAPNYALTSGIGFGFNQGGRLQSAYDKNVLWPNSDLSSAKFDTLPQNAKLHYRLTYVEIPFGLKMRGGSDSGPIQFFAEAPVFTLGFVTKALGDIGGTPSQNVNDEEIRDDVNGLSLAWGLGAGIEYQAAEHATIVSGLYYQHQFTDVTNDDGTVYFVDGANADWKEEKSKGRMGMITLRLAVFF